MYGVFRRESNRKNDERKLIIMQEQKQLYEELNIQKPRADMLVNEIKLTFAKMQKDKLTVVDLINHMKGISINDNETSYCIYMIGCFQTHLIMKK